MAENQRDHWGVVRRHGRQGVAADVRAQNLLERHDGLNPAVADSHSKDGLLAFDIRETNWGRCCPNLPESSVPARRPETRKICPRFVGTFPAKAIFFPSGDHRGRDACIGGSVAALGPAVLQSSRDRESSHLKPGRFANCPEAYNYGVAGIGDRLQEQLAAEVHAGWCPSGTSNPAGLPMADRSVRFRHTSAILIAAVGGKLVSCPLYS